MNNEFGLTRSPKEIVFGDGQRFALGAITAKIGKRALICTDERLASSPVMTELLENLASHGVECSVFGGTLAELPSDSIEACVTEYKDLNPEVVIGVGGGSCLDMAKLVALLLTFRGSLDEYYGELKVPGPLIPVIAMPTTAGTGSEVTPVAVLADKKRDLKVGISSPYLIPHTAICDPELTATCPPGLTAISGADALTHAIEAFTAVRNPVNSDLSQSRVFVGKNLLSDQYALSAIRTVFSYLPRAVANGADREARSKLMEGSLLAGMAFGVAGTAAAHALQYPVGALTQTAHGLGVAALLPYVMRFNAEVAPESYLAIAKALDIKGATDKETVDQLVEMTRALFETIKIPRTIAELGIKESQLDWIAEQSLLAARLVNNNPRKLDFQSMRELVGQAFHGL
ncbi:Alcohol dehydrogenase [Pseudomonas sp. XWY-1]|uniref:Iron-containing alcohol dehydrogenase n=1 Tax=Pseudomonas taiwanensis TaxID=470150 RepID=A0A7L9GAT0_9PSED|nr:MULTISPECIES: iron-containing alcohol dehydrogenase [Pseudomonas]AUZ58527.1 Alcohol dehydrogenase [Pseudomonas sp. XWY-1]QOJ89520.1 iron-containing alcohol dehydrogenase [Pseudomonas taiwanensis]WQQ35118.1 iron-containing alcohol dehydrogenase [Pseudomonas putida]